MKPKVIVIVGPTASGKTGVSIELAKKINGEIISADSMQIYKEMNIGTAKVTEEEMQGIKHYMINIVEPNENFNVAKYRTMAEQAVREIIKKGKIPIIVGGTGLYISTLVNGIELSEEKDNQHIRAKLEEKYNTVGIEPLYEELKKIDPESAKKIDKNNIRRVIRALEIYKQTGKTKSELDRESIKETEFDYRLYGILIDREILYERINERVDMMINQGLIDEVRTLKEKYSFSKTALQGIGYKEVLSFLNNDISKEEMIECIKQESRRYAKRQMTWFKRDERIKWCSKEIIVEEIIKDISIDT